LAPAVVWCRVVKLAAALVVLVLSVAGCGEDRPPQRPIPCTNAETDSLQAALATLSAPCRVDLTDNARCVSPEFKECGGRCQGNEVIFCEKPEGECSGIFNDPAIDDLLRKSSNGRIDHLFVDGQSFGAYQMDTEANAITLESLVKNQGCPAACLAEFVLRRKNIVVTWPKWMSSADPEPACFAEARAAIQKWGAAP
jgi:hypothetical protein